MKPTWVVYRDGWIIEGTFDTAVEAGRYASYCNRSYQGNFSYQACSRRGLADTFNAQERSLFGSARQLDMERGKEMS